MNGRLALLSSLVLLAASCGPQQEPNDDFVDGEMGTITSGLTAGQAGGCNSGIVAGLAAQIIQEVNCIAPSTMVSFAGPGIALNSGVHAVLAPGATSALRATVAARGVTMTVSSAYRTVAEQYVLYKWWKAGQCGIQVAAVPGLSNHQSGRAIDVPSYSGWITPLQARGWTWLGNSDVVHFDFNGAANIGSRSVLAFQKLWNKNNASKLVEDGAWGPASANAMSASPTTGFANAGCAVVPPPPPPPPPPPVNGTLKGKIYKVNPADAADLNSGIAGATVKVNGVTATTDATGIYTVTLPAGTHTIAATAATYSAASLVRQVVANQTVWGSIGLVGSGTPDTVKPDVEILAPAEDGTKVDVAELMVKGTASDDRGVVTSLTVSMNGGAPTALTPGAFSVNVKLASGKNTIKVEAIDPAGNKAFVERTLFFRTGLTGIVTDSLETMPLEGVEVRALDLAGMVLASAMTGADGSYQLDVDSGNRTVVAYLAGYTEYRLPVEVSDETRTAWSFSLTKGIAESGVRFIYPRVDESVLTPTLWVSGIVDGFTPKMVKLNGFTAELHGGNQFTAELPLNVGNNVIEAVATRPDGSAIAARMNVARIDAVTHERTTRVNGGCSAAGGADLSVIAMLLLALTRRLRR